MNYQRISFLHISSFTGDNTVSMTIFNHIRFERSGRQVEPNVHECECMLPFKLEIAYGNVQYSFEFLEYFLNFEQMNPSSMSF